MPRCPDCGLFCSCGGDDDSELISDPLVLEDCEHYADDFSNDDESDDE